MRLFDAEKTMDGFRNEFITPDIFTSLCEIGRDLNLEPWAIDGLAVGRSAFHRAWAFPMRDGNGKTVGIRLREFGGSRKWTVTGSQDGLFYNPELQAERTLANGYPSREIVIVEGATDAIAAAQIGLAAVGRSSCETGGDALAALLARLKVSRMTIVTDNDAYHERADGTRWRPGIDGAIRLARRLKRCYRLITPPKKDLREWVSSGLDKKTFNKVAALQPWKVTPNE